MISSGPTNNLLLSVCIGLYLRAWDWNTEHVQRQNRGEKVLLVSRRNSAE